jgi:hypothetical protein
MAILRLRLEKLDLEQNSGLLDPLVRCLFLLNLRALTPHSS